jgi:hypothetical protein
MNMHKRNGMVGILRARLSNQEQQLFMEKVEHIARECDPLFITNDLGHAVEYCFADEVAYELLIGELD